MNSAYLRIFVTTSHLSTVFITLLAKTSFKENQKDILFIDCGTRREEQIKLIREVSEFHKWTIIRSFSNEVNNSHDFKPSKWKGLIRKLKSWPLLKQVYSKMLKSHLIKDEEKYKSEISDLLNEQVNFANCRTELFLLSQSYLNSSLHKLFPEAKINYIEHGIGDYYYLLDKEIPRNYFYSVFALPFASYVFKQGQSTEWIKQLNGIEHFNSLAQKLREKHAQTIAAWNLPRPSKPVIHILLEAVDIYNVKENFWTDYLLHVLKQLEHPEKYHYLLKAHPLQSHISISKTENFFKNKGLDYTILASEELSCLSIEILFLEWIQQTEHVFCLFSSACFYLSQFYPDPKIKYWYSTEFINRYIQNAPPQYHKLFTEIRPLIEQVFAEKCQSY